MSGISRIQYLEQIVSLGRPVNMGSGLIEPFRGLVHVDAGPLVVVDYFDAGDELNRFLCQRSLNVDGGAHTANPLLKRHMILHVFVVGVVCVHLEIIAWKDS